MLFYMMEGVLGLGTGAGARSNGAMRLGNVYSTIPHKPLGGSCASTRSRRSPGQAPPPAPAA